MSTVEALQTGSSPNGEGFTPVLEEGLSAQLLSKTWKECKLAYELDARIAFFCCCFYFGSCVMGVEGAWASDKECSSPLFYSRK